MRWLTGGTPTSSGCFNYQVYKKPKESQVLIINISPPEFLFIKLLAKSVKISKNENAISVCLKSASNLSSVIVQCIFSSQSLNSRQETQCR